MSKLRFISLTGISSIGPVIPTPALLINISIRFVFEINSVTQERMESSSLTSNFKIGNLESEYFSGKRLVP